MMQFIVSFTCIQVTVDYYKCVNGRDITGFLNSENALQSLSILLSRGVKYACRALTGIAACMYNFSLQFCTLEYMHNYLTNKIKIV